MVDWYLVSVLIFAAFLAVLVYLDRKNWKRESILLLRKTQKGKAFLIWLGNRFPRFWLAVGTFAVIVTLISSIWFVWVLLQSANLILAGQIKSPGGLLLPSPTNQTVSGYGFIAIPFWYWIISIAVLVLVHEGSHGLMAAREKVRIKSLGWGLLAVIPLAFVEPDEKQLQKQKPWKQLRVFSMGSFANYVAAVIFLFVLMFLFIPSFYSPGVSYQGLMKGLPAEQANLTGTIIRIDNYKIDNIQDLSDALGYIGPGKQIIVTTQTVSPNKIDEKTFTLTTTVNPDDPGKGFIGVAGLSEYQNVKAGITYPDMIDFLKGMLAFLFLLNFAIGTFNMLPIVPLDGGRMWEIVIAKIAPNRSKKIMNALSIVFGAIVIIIIFILPLV